MAMTISGTVSARLIQNLRLISRSSGLSSRATVMVRGSRAMPQIGQAPGRGRTTSGCIGQVYSVIAAAVGISDSKAMPHFGQGPGVDWRTSRHMGQTYAPRISGEG